MVGICARLGVLHTRLFVNVNYLVCVYLCCYKKEANISVVLRVQC